MCACVQAEAVEWLGMQAAEGKLPTGSACADVLRALAMGSQVGERQGREDTSACLGLQGSAASKQGAHRSSFADW